MGVVINALSDACGGIATGSVEQQVVDGIAETAARGRQPRLVGEAAKDRLSVAVEQASKSDRPYIGDGATLRDPGDVTFETNHEVRHLPVVTEGPADHAAFDVISRRVADAGGPIDVVAEPERSA